MIRKPGGRGPISERGTLQDFIPRPGDPPPSIPGRPDSKRQKWGGRVLLSDDAALQPFGIMPRATLISTGDLKVPTPINIQLRFANNTGPTNRQPVLPFRYPVQGGTQACRVVIRRGTDPTASPTEDSYIMLPNDVLPIDTVTARELGVDVELNVPGAGAGSTMWVEAIATPIEDVGPTNKVYPYQVTQNPTFIATNAAAVALLPANSDRVQFFITNTSTDADLLLQFGLGPNLLLPAWLPNPRGTLILPRGTFAVYESFSPFTFKGVPAVAAPLRGTIYGIWSNAGNGGAMIHEGTAF